MTTTPPPTPADDDGRRIAEARIEKIRASIQRVGAPAPTRFLLIEVDRLTADLAAARVTIEAMREALLIKGQRCNPEIGCDHPDDCPEGFVCLSCGDGWDEGQPEHHTPDCILATPPDQHGAEILAAGRAMAEAINWMMPLYILRTGAADRDEDVRTNASRSWRRSMTTGARSSRRLGRRGRRAERWGVSRASGVTHVGSWSWSRIAATSRRSGLLAGWERIAMERIARSASAACSSRGRRSQRRACRRRFLRTVRWRMRTRATAICARRPDTTLSTSRWQIDREGAS